MCKGREWGREELVRLSGLILVAAAAVALAGCGGAGHTSSQQRHDPATTGATTGNQTTTPVSPAQRAFARPITSAHLAAGSRPSALPGPILIADRSNSRLLVVDPQGRVRWEFPRPGSGQSLPLPDDAFFAPDGRHIVATEEDVDAIALVDIPSGRVVWRYGTLNVPGSAPGHLAHPDDAMMLGNGRIVAADIENCRLIGLAPPSQRLVGTLGSPVRGCVHNPPYSWGSPNGAFPMANGGWLVTEINGSWVDALSPSGHVLWSVHPPGVYYPSDTNEVRPGLFLTVGWQSPGIVETFDAHGRLHWRYQPRPGDPPLDHPSLALPLPNGDVLVTDDFNDRVIEIDPHTNRIVWQYGHTGVPGTAPGYLSRPDGLDLVSNSIPAGGRARMQLPR